MAHATVTTDVHKAFDIELNFGTKVTLYFVFCADDPITINELEKIVLKAKMLPFSQEKEVNEGACLKNDMMYVNYNESEYTMYIKELALEGKHNIYNSMAAAIAGKVMNIDNRTIREALSSFQAVEHRLEKVLSIGDVLYINDSKATNVDAAWYALECQTRPVVWIVGGTDKGNDYSPLVPLAPIVAQPHAAHERGPVTGAPPSPMFAEPRRRPSRDRAGCNRHRPCRPRSSRRQTWSWARRRAPGA